ncbi:arsenite methyltransferase [Pseudonocardia sp. MH-G8]|uniref:arsenite methyltransferase n=1 Tax=Pseudonocardia sp. MH-G8 TaxID=1854588 RepID=UPI000B9FC07F|nr:arsenite methyltransferase [Pseudonocardia sp. MH-G8]OZM80183.1 arsenite S-adenosylmethyltransferase [Pseudonocardia sp. MH-G8]
MSQDTTASADRPDAAPGQSIRDAVREHYAAAARHSAAGDADKARQAEAAGCCTDSCATTVDAAVFGGDLYGDEASGATAEAVSASLGCGVPTAVAELHPGETVLDLGSGAGTDVLISARRVGPHGRVIGLDMTPEMLDLARRNAAQAGVDNVEFVQGYLEQIPLPGAIVDVVISNCVINLAADKTVVLAEAARVLRPGGRLAVSDVIADPDIDRSTRDDADQWTGCVAGALTREDYARTLGEAGFVDVDIVETHRVHPHAVSAIVRARIPDRAS